jgi:glucokinase
MSGARWLAGIDLGGTKIRAALADADERILGQLEIATSADESDLVDQLVDVVTCLAQQASVGVADIGATAVGGAGVPDRHTGTLGLAPNLAVTNETDLGAALAARLGHEVVVENDVNTAAVGELHAGVGRDVDSFVFVAIGTGIGMGIVIDRRLVRGAGGAAGEIGYLPIGSDPRDPAHHVRGPFEDVVSGPAIAAHYSRLTGRAASTSDVFVLAAAGGDPDATTVVDRFVGDLAQGLVAVNAVLDPACFVLGGGVGSRPDLLDRLRAELPALGAHLDLRASAVPGDPALVGALRLAAQASSLTSEGRLS